MDQNVRDAIVMLDAPGSYTVQAEAGGGKTTLCMDVFEMNADKTVVYLSFTKASVYDATEKYRSRGIVSEHAHTIKTFNSYCLAVLRQLGYTVPSVNEVVTFAKDLNLIYTHGTMKSQYNQLIAYFKDLFMEKKELPAPAQRFVDQCTDFNGKMTGKWDSYAFEMQFVLVYICLCYRQDVIRPLGDVLIVDEVQDLDPFHLEILKLLPFDIKLFVGDSKQAIYAYDGRVNLFRTPFYKEMAYNFELNTTFRFGQEVCDLLYDDVHSASGNATTYEAFDENNWCVDQPRTVILVNSNNKLVETTLSLIAQGNRVAIKRNRVGILKSHFRERERFLKRYEKQTDKYSQYAYGMKLKKDNHYLHVYASRAWDGIPKLLRELEDRSSNVSYYKNGDVLIETVHGFKGLEADNVYVTGSCSPFHTSTQGSWYDKNCLYNVALSRATKTLYLSTAILKDGKIVKPFTGEAKAYESVDIAKKRKR